MCLEMMGRLGKEEKYFCDTLFTKDAEDPHATLKEEGRVESYLEFLRFVDWCMIREVGLFGLEVGCVCGICLLWGLSKR